MLRLVTVKWEYVVYIVTTLLEIVKREHWTTVRKALVTRALTF
jgi:hypothetical protein